MKRTEEDKLINSKKSPGFLPVSADYKPIPSRESYLTNSTSVDQSTSKGDFSLSSQLTTLVNNNGQRQVIDIDDLASNDKDIKTFNPKYKRKRVKKKVDFEVVEKKLMKQTKFYRTMMFTFFAAMIAFNAIFAAFFFK